MIIFHANRRERTENFFPSTFIFFCSFRVKDKKVLFFASKCLEEDMKASMFSFTRTAASRDVYKRLSEQDVKERHQFQV